MPVSNKSSIIAIFLVSLFGLFASNVMAADLHDSTIISLGGTITTPPKSDNSERIVGAAIHLAAISSKLKTLGFISSVEAALVDNKKRGVTQNIFSLGVGPIYQPPFATWVRPYMLVGATTIRSINNQLSTNNSEMLLTYGAGIQFNIPKINGLVDIAVSQTPKNPAFNNVYVGIGVHF